MNFSVTDFLSRLYQKVNDDEVTSHAAQVAFYFTFSLFPLLLFFISLFGLVVRKADDLRTEMFSYLGQIMPASAYTLVQTTIREVAEGTSGGKLTFGLLVALWSASAGLDNLRSSLNAVYNLKETRSWWKTKLLSVLLTLAIGVLVAITLSLIFYGSQLVAYVLPVESPFVMKALSYATVLAALLLSFALVYNFAPNHSPFRWKWITPGAVIGIVLWLLFSGGFQLYLRFFDSYAKTYGSLGAMIILLLWLYLTALVILIGGAVNAIFDEKSGVAKEAKDPKQETEEKTGTGKKDT